jgi:hypothetical protein
MIIVQDLLILARRGVTNTEVLNLNDVISEYFESPEYEKLLDITIILKLILFLKQIYLTLEVRLSI